MSPLLTVKEAARATGLKVPTIRKKLANREIDFCKLGRAVRIPTAAIERLIRENMVPARERRVSNQAAS
jgi:excisionase family DNA binding protein